MEKRDARKLTRDELHERRLEVVRFYEEGVPVMRIVERTGLSWSAVSTTIKRYQTGGESVLRPAVRGRKQGTGRTLTDAQEIEICRLIRARRPWFYRLKNSLWDREAVRQLIEQKYGVNMSERVTGNCLKRWGLAPKKSTRREYDRCTEDIQQWLDVHYAELEQQAQDEDAEIYWVRKRAVIDADVWRPKRILSDQLPETGVSSEPRKKLSMVAVVTNQGKVRWVTIVGSFDSKDQIQFMEALIRDTRKKTLFLIRSGWDTFCSPNFMAWVEASANRVKLFPKSRECIHKSD